MLKVHHLDFSYGRRDVLSDVSFEAHKGKILAVLGPNGSGKSTLLRCLNRILRPRRGELLLENQRIGSMTAEKRAQWIAYVPQKLDTAPLSVFESVLMGRKPYFTWMASKTDLAKVAAMLNRLGLDALAHRSVDQLSGGECQKAALARVLVQEPKLLLLDEPTSALDLKNQVEILTLLQQIVRERNLIVLLMMHDINVAVRYADRFLLLQKGKLVGDVLREGLTPELIESVYGLPVEIHTSERNISFIIEKL
jgi:iron complex transport system ATP-binding protein